MAQPLGLRKGSGAILSQDSHCPQEDGILQAASVVRTAEKDRSPAVFWHRESLQASWPPSLKFCDWHRTQSVH